MRIIEVGPRDGFQNISPFIPTHRKLATVNELYSAGVRSMEVGSFVSERAIPQMRDTGDVLAGALALAGLECRILVPTARRAQQAVSAGAHVIVFVLSVSESHNRNNVVRSVDESLDELRRLVDEVPSPVRVRLDLATSFDCPFDGRIRLEQTMHVFESVLDIAERLAPEVAFCDTTGRATPRSVGRLIAAASSLIPIDRLALHAHDTYGLGIANVFAALDAGIGIFDAALAGLGGCPYAPGASGNVATEDLVWTFAQVGVGSGIDTDRIVRAAQRAAGIAGATPGGRVRLVLDSRELTRSG